MPTWLCKGRTFLFTMSRNCFFFLTVLGRNFGMHHAITLPLRSMPSLCVHISVVDCDTHGCQICNLFLR
ncbi:mCG147185 [Mus musculus]|nr:mCG147185 [Mus musculus]